MSHAIRGEREERAQRVPGTQRPRAHIAKMAGGRERKVQRRPGDGGGEGMLAWMIVQQVVLSRDWEGPGELEALSGA